MTTTPRAYTEDELRDKLLTQIRALAEYWAALPQKTPLERCHGTAFSILAVLDGCNIGLPGMDLVFKPHPADKEFCKSEGENWIEPGTTLSTALHEFYHK